MERRAQRRGETSNERRTPVARGCTLLAFLSLVATTGATPRPVRAEPISGLAVIGAAAQIAAYLKQAYDFWQW